MAAASRQHIAIEDTWLAERTAGWSSASLIARCAFFVLGVAAAGCTAAIFYFMHLQRPELPAGVCMLIAAEWLIVRRRLFHAGIEEALWMAGSLAVALRFLPMTGGEELRIAVLVALALGFSAWRLRNPLMVALAAVVASFAIDFAVGHRQLAEPDVALRASVFCYAIGVAALFLGGLKLQRPSHDQMLNWLMVIMPLCGFLWLATQQSHVIRTATALASLVLGVTALIIGLRRRAHAPLVSCIACFACVGYQLRDVTALPLEAKLVLWGSAALLLALGLGRYLRVPRRGITSSQIGEGGNALDLLQWAGAASLSPKAAPDNPSFKGGGGTYGGGGADGRY